MRKPALVVLSVAGLVIGSIAAWTTTAHEGGSSVSSQVNCGQMDCHSTRSAPSPGAAGATCSIGSSSCSAGGQATGLSAYEREAVTWALARIRTAGSVKGALKGRTPKDALQQAGFDPRRLDLDKVRSAVDREISQGCDDAALTRCSRYRACAIGIDLTEADGALLERYRQQKTEDGQILKNRAAPAFRLPGVDGRTVSLSDYAGRRIALIFWQNYCSHSMRDLPVWNQLRRELAGNRFEILTVLFNGGALPYVKEWYAKSGLSLPVLLADSDAIARAYGSQLVPSVFLIDEHGRLVKKLVTEKGEPALRAELTAFAKVPGSVVTSGSKGGK